MSSLGLHKIPSEKLREELKWTAVEAVDCWDAWSHDPAIDITFDKEAENLTDTRGHTKWLRSRGFGRYFPFPAWGPCPDIEDYVATVKRLGDSIVKQWERLNSALESDTRKPLDAWETLQDRIAFLESRGELEPSLDAAWKRTLALCNVKDGAYFKAPDGADDSMPTRMRPDMDLLQSELRDVRLFTFRLDSFGKTAKDLPKDYRHQLKRTLETRFILRRLYHEDDVFEPVETLTDQWSNIRVGKPENSISWVNMTDTTNAMACDIELGASSDYINWAATHRRELLHPSLNKEAFMSPRILYSALKNRCFRHPQHFLHEDFQQSGVGRGLHLLTGMFVPSLLVEFSGLQKGSRISRAPTSGAASSSSASTDFTYTQCHQCDYWNGIWDPVSPARALNLSKYGVSSLPRQIELAAKCREGSVLTSGDAWLILHTQLAMYTFLAEFSTDMRDKCEKMRKEGEDAQDSVSIDLTEAIQSKHGSMEHFRRWMDPDAEKLQVLIPGLDAPIDHINTRADLLRFMSSAAFVHRTLIKQITRLSRMFNEPVIFCEEIHDELCHHWGLLRGPDNSQALHIEQFHRSPWLQAQLCYDLVRRRLSRMVTMYWNLKVIYQNLTRVQVVFERKHRITAKESSILENQVFRDFTDVARERSRRNNEKLRQLVGDRTIGPLDQDYLVMKSTALVEECASMLVTDMVNRATFVSSERVRAAFTRQTPATELYNEELKIDAAEVEASRTSTESIDSNRNTADTVTSLFDLMGNALVRQRFEIKQMVDTAIANVTVDDELTYDPTKAATKSIHGTLATLHELTEISQDVMHLVTRVAREAWRESKKMQQRRAGLGEYFHLFDVEQQEFVPLNFEDTLDRKDVMPLYRFLSRHVSFANPSTAREADFVMTTTSGANHERAARDLRAFTQKFLMDYCSQVVPDPPDKSEMRKNERQQLWTIIKNHSIVHALQSDQDAYEQELRQQAELDKEAQEADEDVEDGVEDAADDEGYAWDPNDPWLPKRVKKNVQKTQQRRRKKQREKEAREAAQASGAGAASTAADPTSAAPTSAAPTSAAPTAAAPTAAGPSVVAGEASTAQESPANVVNVPAVEASGTTNTESPTEVGSSITVDPNVALASAEQNAQEEQEEQEEQPKSSTISGAGIFTLAVPEREKTPPHVVEERLQRKKEHDERVAKAEAEANRPKTPPKMAPDGTPRTKLSKDASRTLMTVFNKENHKVDQSKVDRMFRELGFDKSKGGRGSAFEFHRNAQSRFNNPLAKQGADKVGCHLHSGELSYGQRTLMGRTMTERNMDLAAIEEWYEVDS